MSLAAAFARQAESCVRLGSPFMGRLMRLLAGRLGPRHGAVAARLYAWPGDPSSNGHSLPLRLAGGLHALARAGRAGLADAYPPHDVDDAALWRAVDAALADEATFLLDWVLSAPQTNEVGRAAAFRAAAHVVAERHPHPLDWMELGASAGLNLHWPRYALEGPGWRRGPADAALTLAPDWTGPPPPDTHPRVACASGVDLAPVAEGERLLAYLWPDQPGRIARAEVALALPRAAVARGDAGYWLAGRLAIPSDPGTTRVVAHSIAWQYFPPATAARARGAIEAAGAAATDDAPLARIAMEADGRADGAALTLRIWPGGAARDLGRVDFHGRWLAWDGGGAS